MASKYDDYWRERLRALEDAVQRAARGERVEIDVAGIADLGDRASWYGRAVVRGTQVVGSSMAHLTSLARMVAKAGICSIAPETDFTFTVYGSLRLSVAQGANARIRSSRPRATALVVSSADPSEEPVAAANACQQIHSLLSSLPAFRSPSEVPFTDGLYFFYEQGEESSHPGGGDRVVRVGNHPRSQARLKKRLRDHYRAGVGAKNGSVFRRYLGGALLRRDNPTSACLAPAPGQGHWERQDEPACPRCSSYEMKITDELERNFEFRCVKIDDREERNAFEARLVATLGACLECQPSNGWLGSNCYSATVRAAGMWNSEFVGGPGITRSHLTRFGDLVRATPGSSASNDLTDTLLLIPCSAGKSGGPEPGLPVRRLAELLGPEASRALTQGRTLAFARNGVTLEQTSPVRPALAWYSGQPYRQPRFRELLGEAMERGLHCLIISGGYGLLLPEEPIHRYGAYLPTQTLTVWRERIPMILRDYVQRHEITRTIGVFSSAYATVIPDDLTGDDRRDVPHLDETDTGSAQTVVPRKIGESLVRALSGLA